MEILRTRSDWIKTHTPLLAPDALVGDDLVTARKLHEEDRNHNPRFFASDSGTGYLCAPAVPYFEISGRTRDRITQIIEARGARGGECNAYLFDIFCESVGERLDPPTGLRRISLR